MYLTYPSAHAKVSAEGSRASDGNAVCFTSNDNGTENQFDFFVPDKHTVSAVGYIHTDIHTYINFIEVLGYLAMDS